MASQMIQVVKRREWKDRAVSLMWSAFIGFSLVAIFIGLALFAVEQMPDPERPSYLTQEK